ncbi:MAG TPA: hypothetical protein VK841_10855 [Polyangiaceae bacterium]|jgi:hypothetical protein|nr:hypothetical protein [Polyangiaceae bacterium]
MSSIRASKAQRLRAAATLAIGLAAASLATASPARAEPATHDEAMAETLFKDAKRLMAAGDYASACPKLAESQKLDPGGGTLTALALCHEQIGKTATAWAEFIEVRTGAQQSGRADREKYARQHIAALEPNLSRLTILVNPGTAQLPDVTVKRDRVSVGQAAWGVASPVDPGEHVIEASAPGKLVWSTRVVVGTDHDSKTVAIPELDDETPATSSSGSGSDAADKVPAFGAAPADTDTKSDSDADGTAADATTAEGTIHRGGTQRVVGLVLGGAGIVAAGVGGYFGVQAISQSNDAKKDCSPASCTDPNAVQSNNDAKTSALVADALLGAGAVTFIAGAILFFSAPSDTPSASAPAGGTTGGLRDVRVLPAMASRGGGVLLQAKW